MSVVYFQCFLLLHFRQAFHLQQQQQLLQTVQSQSQNQTQPQTQIEIDLPEDGPNVVIQPIGSTSPPISLSSSSVLSPSPASPPTLPSLTSSSPIKTQESLPHFPEFLSHPPSHSQLSPSTFTVRTAAKKLLYEPPFHIPTYPPTESHPYTQPPPELFHESRSNLAIEMMMRALRVRPESASAFKPTEVYNSNETSMFECLGTRFSLFSLTLFYS